MSHSLLAKPSYKRLVFWVCQCYSYCVVGLLRRSGGLFSWSRTHWHVHLRTRLCSLPIHAFHLCTLHLLSESRGTILMSDDSVPICVWLALIPRNHFVGGTFAPSVSSKFRVFLTSVRTMDQTLSNDRFSLWTVDTTN
jgi:hypothetical protein